MAGVWLAYLFIGGIHLGMRKVWLSGAAVAFIPLMVSFSRSRPRAIALGVVAGWPLLELSIFLGMVAGLPLPDIVLFFMNNVRNVAGGLFTDDLGAFVPILAPIRPEVYSDAFLGLWVPALMANLAGFVSWAKWRGCVTCVILLAGSVLVGILDTLILDGRGIWSELAGQLVVGVLAASLFVFVSGLIGRVICYYRGGSLVEVIIGLCAGMILGRFLAFMIEGRLRLAYSWRTGPATVREIDLYPLMPIAGALLGALLASRASRNGSPGTNP
jgi:hypothetical protein